MIRVTRDKGELWDVSFIGFNVWMYRPIEDEATVCGYQMSHRAIQIGTPVSKGLVTILLEPWPDLYCDAMVREGMGWINLLQAAAARIERALE